MYGQRLWTVNEGGNFVSTGTATTDEGQWLPDDEVPPTLESLLEVFFEEMWPVLRSSMDVFAAYIAANRETSTHPQRWAKGGGGVTGAGGRVPPVPRPFELRICI